MDLLFCDDGPIKKDEYNNYYGVSHTDEMYSRYYTLADRIVIAIRINNTLKSEVETKLSKINITPVKMVPCPNIASIKGFFINRKKAKDIIRIEVLKAGCVIARLPSLIGFLGVHYARLYNVPYFIEVVACPWDAYWNHSFLGKLIAPFIYLVTKKQVKNAPYALYVTNRFLQERYPCKGITVACSDVSLPAIENIVLEKRLKKISTMDLSKKIIIGTTAAVNIKYKGQQYIIKALGRLKKEGLDNYEYHLVGGGDNSYLKTVAKKYDVTDQVKFIGPVPHNQVFNWLDTIDLYCQPSRQEGLPRALVEAMSRGCPAIGAKTGGIPELIMPEYIFSNGNMKEICDLLKLFTDKNQLIKQARTCFNKAKEFESEYLNDKRNEFYNNFKNSINSRKQ